MSEDASVSFKKRKRKATTRESTITSLDDGTDAAESKEAKEVKESTNDEGAPAAEDGGAGAAPGSPRRDPEERIEAAEPAEADDRFRPWKKQKREGKDNPLVASTRRKLDKSAAADDYTSNRSAAPDDANMKRQIEGLVDTTPRTVPENKPKWVGPMKQQTTARAISRFDYQPDLCKDYKETGYCGFGDSCKFMHDRGDYKSGWQLEKEFKIDQEMKKRKALGENVPDEENYHIKDEEELPFACLICRKDFTNPVVTRCKHYFCESCALKHFQKDTKCFVCAQQTHGIFNTATKIIAMSAKAKAQNAAAAAAPKKETPKSGAAGWAIT